MRHLMRVIGRATSAVLMVAVVSLVTTAPAQAADCSVPFNGTYTAFSDGQWAKTNDSYHDEVSVTTTWTVTTSCASYIDCTGQVVSDAGWTASAKIGRASCRERV